MHGCAPSDLFLPADAELLRRMKFDQTVRVAVQRQKAMDLDMALGAQAKDNRTADVQAAIIARLEFLKGY